MEREGQIVVRPFYCFASHVIVCFNFLIGMLVKLVKFWQLVQKSCLSPKNVVHWNAMF